MAVIIKQQGQILSYLWGILYLNNSHKSISFLKINNLCHTLEMYYAIFLSKKPQLPSFKEGINRILNK